MFGLYLDLKRPQKSIPGVILKMLGNTKLWSTKVLKHFNNQPKTSHSHAHYFLKFYKFIIVGLYLELKRPNKSIPDVILGLNSLFFWIINHAQFYHGKKGASLIPLGKQLYMFCREEDKYNQKYTQDKRWKLRAAGGKLASATHAQDFTAHLGGGGGNAILGYTFLGPFLDFQGVHGLK